MYGAGSETFKLPYMVRSGVALVLIKSILGKPLVQFAHDVVAGNFGHDGSSGYRRHQAVTLHDGAYIAGHLRGAIAVNQYLLRAQ